MGSLKIKQKKKAFIPYTNKQSHMFAQSIQNCQKELKEMELKAFDDGFEDGKNWSDVLNFVILFYVMHELHGWGWKRYMKSVKRINNYINDINSGKTSLSEMVDDLEKKVVESLMNRFRVVSNDEDLEWNRAIDYAIKIVKGGGVNGN